MSRFPIRTITTEQNKNQNRRGKKKNKYRYHVMHVIGYAENDSRKKAKQKQNGKRSLNRQKEI